MSFPHLLPKCSPSVSPPSYWPLSKFDSAELTSPSGGLTVAHGNQHDEKKCEQSLTVSDRPNRRENANVPKKRLRPAKLAEAIAAYLETLIIEGSLRAGDRLLAERDLTQKLGISRPSLREGLRLLEQRGLVRSERGGTYVTRLLEHMFSAPILSKMQGRFGPTSDYLEFRSTLEGAAAYFAALRASNADRDRLTERFAMMERARAETDGEAEILADKSFHLALYEVSHNIILLHVMNGMCDAMRRSIFYNRPNLQQGIGDLLFEQHRRIFGAVIKGDAETARTAAENHVNFLRIALEEIDETDLLLERSLHGIVSDAFEKTPIDTRGIGAPGNTAASQILPYGIIEDSPQESGIDLLELLKLHPNAIGDYLEFRLIVDGMSAQMATEHADEADWNSIATAFEAIAEAARGDDPERQYQADHEFHLSIYAAAHNTVIDHVMHSVFAMLQRDVFYNREQFNNDKGLRRVLLRQHKTIFNAIMAYKPEKARRAAEKHVRYIQTALRESRLAEQRAAVSERRTARRGLVQSNGDEG